MTSQLYLKGIIRPVPSGEAGKKIDGPKNATRNVAEQEAYHNYRTVYAPPVGFGKSIWISPEFCDYRRGVRRAASGNSRMSSKTSRTWVGPIWRLLVAVGVILLWASPVCAQSVSAQPGVALPPATERQIEMLLAQKAQRTAAQRKLSSQLLDAIGGAQPSDGVTRWQVPTKGVRGKMVKVDIRADVTPAALERIRALGGTVVSSAPKYRSIQARLPLSTLEPFATPAAVQSIRPADQAQTRGQRTTD